MKESFELEDSFKRLDHIPRSEFQKKKTYENIVRQSQSSTHLNSFFSHLKGTFLTITMVLISTLFLYVQVTAIGQQSSIKTADHFASGEVVGTFLTRSEEDHYFSLNNNVTRKGVSIIEDKTWMKTISSALNGMEASTEVLSEAATYDFLIIFDGRESAKCKLWISGREVYIKQMKDEQFYKIDAVNASKIIRTINEIEKQVLY